MNIVFNMNIPVFPDVPALRVSITGYSMPLEEGEPLSLACKVTTIMNVNYTWTFYPRKQFKSMEGEKFMVISRRPSFSFPFSHPDMTGLYKCTAAGEDGKSSSSQWVEILPPGVRSSMNEPNFREKVKYFFVNYKIHLLQFLAVLMILTIPVLIVTIFIFSFWRYRNKALKSEAGILNV